MLDPLTLTGTICSLAKSVFESATSLYNFIQKADGVGETVRLLYDELYTLQGLVNSLVDVTERDRDGWEELDLWEKLEDSLGALGEVINAFNERLVGLMRRSGGIQDLWTQFKLEMRDAEIADIRAQIQTHMMALNIVLQMANVVKATKQQATSGEINEKVDRILEMLDADANAAGTPKTTNAALYNKYTSLRASIRVAASNMSESLGSGTTRFAQSEPDLSWTKPIAVPNHAKPSDTTGSEYGEPLKPDSKARITSWARAAWMTEVPEEPHISSNESRDTEDSLASGSVTLVDDFGSDEEIEAEAAERQIAVAKQRFEAGKYASAETMLRKAYDKATKLHKRPASLDLKQLSFEIARACFEQHKYDDSHEMCVRLLKELPQDDSSRVQVLNASHLLAQIHLCRREFPQARTQCRQTMNGRKRLEGKSAGYYASLAFMVAIYEAQDDEDEALTWEGFLPEDYVKPTFHKAIGIDSRMPSGPTSKPTDNPHLPRHPLTKEALRSRDDLALKPAQYSPTAKRQANLSLPLDTKNAPLRPPPPPPPPLQLIITALKEDANSSQQAGHSFQPPKLPRPFGSEGKRTTPSRKPIPSRAVSDPVTGRGRPDLYDLPPIPKLPPVSTALDQGQQTEALRLLAMDGWDPALKGFDGNSALLNAAADGNDLIVQLLLQGWSQVVKRKGIKALGGRRWETLNFQPVYADTADASKKTPLHHAASQGHASTSQLLLEHGASGAKRALCDTPDCPNFNCSLGRTPLELAVRAGHLPVVQVFLALGTALPDPGHKDGLPLLHAAAARGEREIFALLLASGMDIMSRTMGGDSPLHSAADNGQESLVIFILQQGAEIDALNHKGQTALHLAASFGSLDCVETLIEKGAGVDRVDYDKWPVLHFAANYGHTNLIPYLLSCEVDLNARDRDGKTAMHLAAEEGWADFLKRCRLGNADVASCDNEGFNILHLSAYAGFADVVTLALDAGLPVDDLTHEGESALLLAAAAGHNDVVELLITSKADVNAKGADGLTAFQYAVDLQDTEMAQRLRYAGAEYCNCLACEAVLAGQVHHEDSPERRDPSVGAARELSG